MRQPAVKRILLILFILVIPLEAANANGLQDQQESMIDTYIARQAERLRGEEYREARKLASGDLTGDGIAETAVLYTIEGQGGSNTYVQYLAVFAPGKGRLVALTNTPVGGKSSRSVESLAIDKNTIQLATLSYGPQDPSCCPSRKGTTRFVLAGKRLRELKLPSGRGAAK
jgi:hypothetical protein